MWRQWWCALLLGVLLCAGLMGDEDKPGPGVDVEREEPILKHLESVAWINTGRHHTATLRLKSDYTYELTETERYEEETTTTRRGKWSVVSRPLALIALDGKLGVRIFQTNADTAKGGYERVGLRRQQLRADDRPARWLEVAKGWYAPLLGLARLGGETTVVPLPKQQTDAIDLEHQTVPVSIQRRVASLIRKGWCSEVLGDAVLIARNRKVETFGTINMPFYSSVEDLRKMKMTLDERYVITLRVGPRMSLEEYRKKEAENAEIKRKMVSMRNTMRHITHKFDSYLPSTPAERKLVKEYEKLKNSRHDLPDRYSGTHSIWICESTGRYDEFADQAVGKECRDVRRKIADLFRSYDR